MAISQLAICGIGQDWDVGTKMALSTFSRVILNIDSFKKKLLRAVSDKKWANLKCSAAHYFTLGGLKKYLAKKQVALEAYIIGGKIRMCIRV